MEFEDSQDERMRAVMRVADPATLAGTAPLRVDSPNVAASGETATTSGPVPTLTDLAVRTAATSTAVPRSATPSPGTGAAPSDARASLPAHSLEALGDQKLETRCLDLKYLQDAISERWGRVLVDGLTKEQKQTMHDKMLIPENFIMVKAPVLNPEIIPALSAYVKTRDRLLE